ncbi:tyrosine-type recombinase/integrase [Sediminicoccus rosea]|uniref:Tyrosine-type recombinase/integrase n=1 Tax=Sediminicoccus rosea TaxID=1225128 RepID=A0ABZ0PL48_9PROT|nr:integrase arm-type DNA-binding domain-containing protein [Sediminicoccus rosea]WPB86424.1 tyrosine-type recombinase/integrase [Sediminicoccus rosea]
MADISAKALKARLSALAENPPGKVVRIMAGAGLHLLVKPTHEAGAGVWVLRVTVAGKRRDMSLGAFPLVGLADARMAAEDARRLATKGADPIAARAEKKAAAAPAVTTTFKAAAEALHRAKAPEWKNPKHGAQWLATLKAHVFPKIGARPVAKVDTDDVLRVLQPIWTKTPETASRVRGRIEAVLNYAAATGSRPRGPNPATWRGHLSEALGAPSRLKAVVRREKGKGENHPSLPWQEMPAFMEALEGRKGMAALALRFSILTGARTGEVRGMTWGEVNEADAVWIVPAARMKAGKVHFVPLSPAALAVLEEVKKLAEGRDSLVFPGQRSGKALSDMTLSMLVRGMATDGLAEGELPRWRDPEGRVVVPHGFRASFKAWSLAQGWGDHLSEKALAHTDKDKVRAAYAREPLTEERRPMMEAWAAWRAKSAPAVVASLAAEKAKRQASA